jgi:hypothetical protein
MPKRNPEPDFTEFNGAFYRNATQEMYVPRSDEAPGLVPTGFFFEPVIQAQPGVQNMEGPRNFVVRPSPWQWARQDTAEYVMVLLKPYLPGVELSLQKGDTNTQFPYSHDQWEIRAKRGARKARINAGLLAQNIARSTSTVDGEVKNFPAPRLEAAAAELLKGLEEPKDE